MWNASTPAVEKHCVVPMDRMQANRIPSVIIWAAFAAALVVVPLHAQSYRATLLSSTDFFGGSPDVLNDSGAVVGTGNNGNYSGALEYSGGVISDLGLPPNWTLDYANVINSAGVVYGVAVDASRKVVLVEYAGGNITELTTANVALYFIGGVNAAGTVVGGVESLTGQTDAFAYIAGVPTDLGMVSGHVEDNLYAVNSSGTMVGFGVDATYASHAIGVSNGVLVDLGWGAGSEAVAINDSGTIVGIGPVAGNQRGISYNNGVFTDLGLLPNGTATQPMAINNAGTIVGEAWANPANPQQTAFIYLNGAVTDLNTLVDIPGDRLLSAVAINNEGQIVASGLNGVNWYLLTPVTLHFSVSVPASVSLGTPFTVTVTALDASNDPAPYYAGTVRITSSDGAAILPADSMLNAGVGTFTVTLSTSGSQTVTATDTRNPSISGISGPIVPSMGPSISALPAVQPVNVGSSATFSVTASGTPPPTYQWTFDGKAILGATGATYSVANAQVSDSGGYAVIVTNVAGTVVSGTSILTVVAASGGPAIKDQPSSYSIYSGETVVLTVGMSATGAAAATLRPDAAAGLTYKWYFDGNILSDGAGISGSQTGTLVLSGSATRPGAFACLVENGSGSVLSQTAELSLSNATYPSRLINVSCRAEVGSGADILIAGFVVGGGASNGTLPVLVRGSGPALAAFNVPGVLPDPDLQLFSTAPGPVLVASNFAWGGGSALSSAAAAVGAFAWTVPSSNDAALLENLAPGPYTANLSGRTGDSGVALAEVYDATPGASLTASSPRLINISARVLVGTGANSLIAGFVVGGDTAMTVLIRASGPALAPYGVSGTLPDPELQLNDPGGVIAANSGWQGDTQIAAAAAQVGAFSWGAAATPDSALLVTLPPGAYTATVSGADGDSGVGLVEVYEVR